MLSRHSVSAVTACIVTLAVFATACETDSGEFTESLSLESRAATEMLPPDPDFVGMARIADFADNPVLGPLLDSGWLSDSDSEAAARIVDFLAATDFDPEHDMDAAYLAATRRSNDRGPSIVVLGQFDRERIYSYVEEQYADEFDRSEHGGVTIYATAERHHGLAFALPSDGTLIASSSPTIVREMIDRQSSGGPSLASDDELMELVRKVAGQSAWMVARDLRPESVGANPWSAAWRAVGRVAAAIQVTEQGVDGVAYLTPADDVEARDLAALARGMVAGIKTSSGLTDAQRRTIESTEVDASDDEVVVRFSAPNDLLEELRDN